MHCLTLQILTSIALHIDIVPVSSWGPAFVSAGLIAKLFHDATQPNVGTALPHYSSLFAKMILAEPSAFLELLRMSEIPKPAFLDLWWTAVSISASPPPSIPLSFLPLTRVQLPSMPVRSHRSLFHPETRRACLGRAVCDRRRRSAPALLGRVC